MYSQSMLTSLYAAAWHERAYALMVVGEYREAIEAVDTAEHALVHLAASDYDRARLLLTRSLILREMEQFEAALLCAMDSASVFAAFGDTKRETYATWTEGAIAYRKRDYATALTLFAIAERGLRDSDERSSHAILLHNIASCHREMGDHKNAMAYFEQAMAAYDELGSVAARVRTRWHIGKTLLLQGYHNSAMQQLQAVRDEFDGLQMETESRLAALDIAECLLALQRDRQVVELCSALIARFEKSGLTNTTGAMTALAFLREAAAKNQQPIVAVKHVRRYFEALQKQPALLFAPPPA
jgi:tetratricopeptide (TPR) repeat protein